VLSSVEHAAAPSISRHRPIVLLDTFVAIGERVYRH